jgi:hypothetical protein
MGWSQSLRCNLTHYQTDRDSSVVFVANVDTRAEILSEERSKLASDPSHEPRVAH